MQSKSLSLTIAHTWDGQDIPTTEQVQLELSFNTDCLVVQLEAPFHHDPPPPGPPGPTNQLWNYEVVELFLCQQVDTNPSYLEVELSPHGHHLVLQLHGIRQPQHTLLPLSFQASIHKDRWQGHAEIPLSYLPPPPHSYNAFAIHGSADARRYLAHAPVPGPQPDFHRLHLFPTLPLQRNP